MLIFPLKTQIIIEGTVKDAKTEEPINVLIYLWRKLKFEKIISLEEQKTLNAIFGIQNYMIKRITFIRIN